jgi:restriction system protein
MAIPTYDALMLPLLQRVSDGETHRFRELADTLAENFHLSDEERERLLPSGKQTVIRNRVGWARTYLVKAGLVESPKRGTVRITAQGREVLAASPARIDIPFLSQFESFRDFKTQRKEPKSDLQPDEDSSDETPEENIESAYRELRSALADELLESVKACSPQFFERLVVELLVAMGYGGSIEDAGRAIGRSGDGGIDGIIKEDRLGLDVVCIQAKRWGTNSVGRPEVQAFAGSMDGHRARKGVLITTSQFSKEACEFVERIERKIVLIDGKRLAELMIDFDIGVAPVRAYAIKRLDSDYFADGGD